MDLDLALFEEVATLVRAHFQCPKAIVTPQTTAPEITGWDSLAHSIFIIKVERSFGIEIADDRIFALRNVGDLALAVQESRRG